MRKRSIRKATPRGDGSGTKTLTWPGADKIDWGTVVLVGVGLTIGAMTNKTGLAETLGEALASATGVRSTWLLCLIAIVIGVDPIIPAIAGVFAANAGAMLPVSTPPNAIVYGSGFVPMKKMIVTGIFVDVVCIPLLFLATFGIGSLLGLTS
jgi:solute carrier family 13 (sodium-dependent dicarboxylate transporter), member 2/3/5